MRAMPHPTRTRRSLMNSQQAKDLRTAPLKTRTYVKTKNFHWHISGAHFRDYHPLLDEQADQIFATTDIIAERVRKIGGMTVRSIGHIGRLQRIKDNDADFV